MDLSSEDRHGEKDLTRYSVWCLWHALRAESEEVAALRRQLEAMYHSKSWRITAPLRRVMDWMTSRAGTRDARPRLGSADAISTPNAKAWPWDEIAREAPWLSLCLPGGLPAESSQQLLVDVTELALEDLGAGIQRVVGRILAELIFAPPAGYAVSPVRLSADGRYAHARRFLAAFLGLPEGALGHDDPVRARPGDLFLGLDLVRDRASAAAEALGELRASGAEVALVVYDLLPLQHPEWFPPGVPERFSEWIDAVALKADRLICISEAVRRECEQLVVARSPASPPKMGRFPLGADFVSWVPQISVLPGQEAAPRFLMVGTIEPRKGHAQALAAFERLWAEGRNLQLVIVGHVGWNVSELVARLKAHPERGRRLHWIDSPDDRMLASLYRECDCLLMATHGEGFGLPVVEALRAGCRLLLRDLPVLREVAGDRAAYFAGSEPEALAEAIAATLPDLANPAARQPVHTETDWSQSVHALKAACGLTSNPVPTRIDNQ